MSEDDAHPRRTRTRCRNPLAGARSQEDLVDPGDVDAAADPVRVARRARDAELVEGVRRGDERAFGRLYDDWFDRVYDVARRIVRDDEVAADVAQEAFLSAWRNLDSLADPGSFGGWILRIARNGALNRQQKERRSTAVDDQAFAVIEARGGSSGGAPAGFAVEDRLGRAATPGAAIEDREIVDLVWEAADALGPRDLEVLDLQLRHGLSPAEVGEVLGMNRNAANQVVHRLRGRLETAVRARVVWRGGAPACDVLRERLRQSSITAFGADAVRVIERHLPGCVTCDERQRLRLQPSALFAAVPIMVAPVFLKAQAAAALTAAGVPLQGSVLVAGGGAASSATGAGPGSGTRTGGAGASDGGASAIEPSAIEPATIEPSAGVSSSIEPSATAVHQVADTGRSPTASTSARAAAASRRRLLLGAMAAALVLGLLIAGLLTRRGPADERDVVTADGTRPPTPTTAVTTADPPMTDGAPTTDGPTTVAPPTTGANPTTPPPSVVPTTAPAPPTSPPSSTTTTALTARATFVLTPATAPSTGWTRPAPAGATSPTLTWTVTGNGPITVEVTGPELVGAISPLSSAPTGSLVVCPRRTDTSGSTTYCTTSDPKGDTFTLTVSAPDGTELLTRSVTLAPYVIP